jgi:hypothetical protein
MLSSNREFNVSLRLQSTVVDAETADQRWGGSGTDSDLAISELVVTLEGDTVSIPDKAYGDLWNVDLPAGVGLTENGDTVFVYLNGGDGASVYYSKLVVVSHRVVRRLTTGDYRDWDGAELVDMPNGD